MCHAQRHIILWFCLPFVVLCFTWTPTTSGQVRMELSPLSSSFLRCLFFYHPWCGNLINSNITDSLAIKTFCNRDNNSFSLRPNKLFFNKSEDPSYILSSFIGKELNKYLDIVFFGLVFEGNLLIKCKFIRRRCWYFGGDRVGVVLEIDLTWKFNFKG